MRKLKVEPVPCHKCGNIPHFVPLPTAEFPTEYGACCACKNRMLSYKFGYKTKSYKGFFTRRFSVNTAIRRWNKHVSDHAKRTRSFYIEDNKSLDTTCKFCKKDGLMWGKRPYQTKWQGSANYVLYERVPVEETCQLTGMKRIKFVIHNCLANKNVVKVEYTQL